MTLRLTLSAHGSSHLEIGLVVDDDGHVTGWQTAGWRVGRFARNLTAAERASLAAALEAAGSTPPEPAEGQLAESPPADPPAAPRPPSGSTEQLVADGLPDVTFASNATPPPGFDDLIEVLRGVRENIAESPVAAIELDVSASPLSARLRHVGTEPVDVRSDGELHLAAVVYDADYLEVDRAAPPVPSAPPNGAVSPGWVLDLVDRLDLSPPPRGGFVSITVGSLRVDSLGDGVLRQAEFSWVSE
jgi:hypothetical protein